MTATPPIFSPMARRRHLGQDDGLPAPRRVVAPRARLVSATIRVFAWAMVSSLMLWRVGLDMLRRRLTLRRLGLHLRRAFETMGAIGTKVGQQLSIRVDLLPFEICDELAGLTDSAQPMPLSAAVREIEACIGGPLSTQFAAFDPEPIGAASVACVYQATLHSGERVAIKVQRPDVAQRFADDIFAFNLMTHLAEMFGIVRPDYFKFLRTDMSTMFLEELDFYKEARAQRLFRYYVRRARIPWLTSPKVYSELCGERVIVSAFVEAVSCADIVRARESGNPQAAAQLAELGIDPDLLGRRLYHLSCWARLEAPFFHADPHPANILVERGGRICMIDFGACGSLGSASARLQHEALERIVEHDIFGLVQLMRLDTSPIPALDLDAITHEMERRFWQFQLAILDKGAAWWEKTTAGLWIAMLDTARKFNMPINLNTLRMIRGTLLYDTLAFRLAPGLDATETREYLHDAIRRQGRKARKTLKRARAADPLLRLDRVAERLEAASELRPRFEALVGKAASTALATARLALVPATAGFGLIVLLALQRRGVLDLRPWYALGATLLIRLDNPLVLPLVGLPAALVLLRLMTRLQAVRDGRG